MTNFGKSAIIINGELLQIPHLGNIKTIEIKTEDYADETTDSMRLHSKCENTCEKNKKKMENQNIAPVDVATDSDYDGAGVVELSVNLTEAANYLIQLFYMTGQIYTCTRTKIGKLLSILAFKYACENQKLFNEDIYKYKDCGTTINELKGIVDRDVYLQYEYHDAIETVTASFIDNAEIPKKYIGTDTLSNDIMESIECVFRKFGAYSASDLGQCINPIVECDGVADADGRINLSKFSDFEAADIALLLNPPHTNNVARYLFA